MNLSIDLTGLAQAIVGALGSFIQQTLAPAPNNLEQFLYTSMQGFLDSMNQFNLLTHNPLEWTSRDSDVVGMYHQFIPAELGLATIVLVIQGYRVASGRVDMYEAIFRTAFFVLLGEGMLFIIDPVLGLVNAASDVVTSTHITRAEHAPSDNIQLSFLLIVGLFFALLAWVKGAVGVVFLKVLIVSAPVLLTLSALPFFEGLGKWWAEEATTWIMRPFMVALVLRLGLGLAAIDNGPVGMLFDIVTFWLAYTMDTRIRRFSVGAWGSVGQLGLFARGARTFSGALGAGSVAAAPAAAAAAP